MTRSPAYEEDVIGSTTLYFTHAELRASAVRVDEFVEAAEREAERVARGRTRGQCGSAATAAGGHGVIGVFKRREESVLTGASRNSASEIHEIL